jgi:hypothetical protein
MNAKNVNTQSTASANEGTVKRLSLRREVVRNLTVRTSVRTGNNVGSCMGLYTESQIPSVSVVHSGPNPK